MGAIGQDLKVKLFCGIISSMQIDEKVISQLEEKFGKIDLTSSIIPFNYTSYYALQMAQNLSRYWISFDDLVYSGSLADIKVFTNSIEDTLVIDGKRPINIDPGYISL
jgi:hypothetical protein